MIKLIINADDFGYSKLFNKMILELIAEKAVTSTSVMIDELDSGQKEQTKKLISLSKKNLVSVGLHVYFKNTQFREELQRQFDAFVNTFGFEPSHIDIHKMDHLKEGYTKIQKWLATLSSGFHVIVFHPGYYDPQSKSSLNQEREEDAKNCRKLVRVLSKYKIGLANFKDLTSSYSY